MSVTDYPYEGDLLAVVEAVTVPRLVHETADALCKLLGVPLIPKSELDAILAPLDRLPWKGL